MTKIIDVILHKNKHYTQTFIVIDESPDIKYEREGEFLIGECDGFFSFYKYERPSRHAKAFSGRKFTIPMKDGSNIEADGQWWDEIPDDYNELGLLYSTGANTPEKLSSCNVFMGYKIDKQLIDDWLENNEPSNNYYKYDSKNKDTFMKHTIISKW